MTVKENEDGWGVEPDERPTIRFEDKGALDTFLGLSGATPEQVQEIREQVAEKGYGEPIHIPDDLL